MLRFLFQMCSISSANFVSVIATSTEFVHGDTCDVIKACAATSKNQVEIEEQEESVAAGLDLLQLDKQTSVSVRENLPEPAPTTSSHVKSKQEHYAAEVRSSARAVHEHRENASAKLDFGQLRTAVKAETNGDDIGFNKLRPVWNGADLKSKLDLASDIIHIVPSIVAATRLNLWDAIPENNGATFDEIVSRTETSAKGMETLLQVLLSIGAVTWSSDAERYYNEFSKLGDIDIKKITTNILGDSVSMQRQLYYLTDSVREGRAVGLTEVYGDYESIYEARADIPELAKDWDPWMDSHDDDIAGRINRFLYELPSVVARIGKNAKQFKGHVLDWCGNDGNNAIKLAQSDPTMKLTVLDLPAQVEKAATSVAAAGLQGQIDTMGVDLYDDDLVFEHKYEAVFMIHMHREWPWADLTQFATTIHSVLKPGGVVILYPIKTSESIRLTLAKSEVYFLNSASHTQVPKSGNQIKSMLVGVGFTDVTYDSNLHYVAAVKP